MKNIITILFAVLLAQDIYAQARGNNSNDEKFACITSENINCRSALKVCEATAFDWCFLGCEECQSVFYSFDFTSSGSFDLSTYGSDVTYIFYGPMLGNIDEACELVNSNTAPMLSGNITSTTSNTTLSYESGIYILQIEPDYYHGGGSFSGESLSKNSNCNEPIPDYFTTNTSCASAINWCNSESFTDINEFTANFSWNIPTVDGDCPPTSSLYYSFAFNNTGAFNLALPNITANYSWYGPMTGNIVEACELVNTYSAPMISGTSTPSSPNATLSYEPGVYVLQILPNTCSGSGSFSGESLGANIDCEETLPCTDCVTSFQPTPGRYIISAWVKEASASQTVTTYENTSIGISFANSTVTYSFIPSGRIIDGWQRIEADFNVPAIAQSIEITLNVTKGDAFFDDIRFFPFDGSMMSYVYDPISLRLMAELDERNYATFYEYDEEGKLIRVKKETEKGVMTIQENRDNIRK